MTHQFLRTPERDCVRVGAEALRRQIVAVLRALDVPVEHARITADVLVAADLRGVDSHGAASLPRYVERIRSGSYKIPQHVELVSESATTALLSGGGGLGAVAAFGGMQLAIQKARSFGVGSVAIRDAGHVGMLGYYPLMAAECDMIGLAMTNASPSTRPALGARPRLGTNPIAFAAPTQEHPFLLDMATSTVSGGKLALAGRLGVPIPPGWIVSAEGEPLTDPTLARSEAWSHNPLGGELEQGAHKGYGLAVMVDVLVGVLSGGGSSTLLEQGRNATFVLALDIARFRDVEDFKSMMDAMLRELRATPPAPGAERVRVAGDPEAEAREDRLARGVPLHRDDHRALQSTAHEVGAELLL